MQNLAPKLPDTACIETLELRVGEWIFRVRAPAEIHPRHGVTFSAQTLRKSDHERARIIAESGVIDAHSFQFLRKVARVKKVDLAELLCVPANTVDKWESSEDPIDRLAAILVGQMALDAIAGNTSTIDRLKRSLTATPRAVDIDLTK